MKKILSLFALVLIITGCSLNDMDNTPTKKVENYLNNYQRLDESVLDKLDEIIEKENFTTEELNSSYRDILKKHYQDLTYVIKEETINADKATVETEIEVSDYTKILKEFEIKKDSKDTQFLDENGNFDEVKFTNSKLNALKDNKERVKYTIYFSLTKEDNSWVLDPLTSGEEEKILGIYEY